MRTMSIVVPVFHNELNLPSSIPQLLELRNLMPTYRLELIFVDDGSKDRSMEVLREFAAKHAGTIRVVKLTRNFGSMAAIQAGLEVATGDCIGMISADLQDPPELFVRMLEHWEKGSKAVLAVRARREDPSLQRAFSNGYYALVRLLALPGYPPGGFDFFLVDRQVISELNAIHEKNTNILSLLFWLGFEPVLIPYTRRRRTAGRSRWTLSKKVKLFVDTFVSFSFVPIRVLSLVGFLAALTAFLYGGFLLAYWWLFGIPVQGYVPIMLAITFASGAQLTMLGVLGEYLWRVLDEVRRRPRFVVDTTMGEQIDAPSAGFQPAEETV